MAATGSWAFATRFRHGWIAHVVFIPTLLGVEWLLTSLLFWGARDDGDGPPGLGLMMIPAILILPSTIVLYYAVLIFRGVAELTNSRRN